MNGSTKARIAAMHLKLCGRKAKHCGLLCINTNLPSLITYLKGQLGDRRDLTMIQRNNMYTAAFKEQKSNIQLMSFGYKRLGNL